MDTRRSDLIFDASDREVLAGKALLNCRTQLCRRFPAFDGAFANLELRACWGMGGAGTDGAAFRFDPDWVIRRYGEDPAAVRRVYLHSLLHCLYLHMFLPARKRRELWELACDMAVERTAEQAGVRPRTEEPVRSRCLEILEQNRAVSAEQCYGLLEAACFPFSQKEMARAFSLDQHGPWSAPGCGREKWERIVSVSAGKRKLGARAGSGRETVALPVRRYRDYRSFLRRFAVTREEMALDPDAFDKNFYYWGMERYGDLPLLEPLESREGRKLSQLVIAIDTSGSCSAEKVAEFLGETYEILMGQGDLFGEMEVHLIQCDCVLQTVTVIRSREQWRAYSREITIQGRGGTDFTPVFRYVAKQQAKGQLRELKGLLYFTDGDGVYPREAPEYETAFVFTEPTEFMERVPSWAVTLLTRE